VSLCVCVCRGERFVCLVVRARVPVSACGGGSGLRASLVACCHWSLVEASPELTQCYLLLREMLGSSNVVTTSSFLGNLVRVSSHGPGSIDTRASGGAVWASSHMPNPLAITKSRFVANTATANSTFYYATVRAMGGAVFGGPAVLWLSKCAFIDNSAEAWCRVHCEALGGALGLMQSSLALLNGSQLTGNVARSSVIAYGGALGSEEQNEGTVVGCTFRANTAVAMGALASLAGGGAMAVTVGSGQLVHLWNTVGLSRPLCCVDLAEVVSLTDRCCMPPDLCRQPGRGAERYCTSQRARRRPVNSCHCGGYPPSCGVAQW
jgi:hypothetical protein